MNPRSYVWGQVFAAKLTIHGFTVADAAMEADAALAEFDKRTFDGNPEISSRDAAILGLETELDAAHEQNEKDTASLLAAQAEIAKLGEALAQATAEIAHRDATVTAIE